MSFLLQHSDLSTSALTCGRRVTVLRSLVWSYTSSILEASYGGCYLVYHITTNRISGQRIAETFAAIVHQYNIQDRVGYFTTDNASNNDTCMEFLGDKFDFTHVVRRVRCVGHVLDTWQRPSKIGQLSF